MTHILPKIEFHLHLDYCLSYEAVRRLALDVTPEAFARDFVVPARAHSGIITIYVTTEK